jgi:predicted anti-sigma-YlaC factor YlaD
MTCRQLVELVTDYFEGALSDEDMRRFDEHLSDCHWCSRYIEQMRVTIRVVGRIDEESISAGARETLLVAFRDWNAGALPLP